MQIRELCEAAAGIKLSRVNLDDGQIEAIRPWCEEMRLSLSVTDYLVQSNVQDEGKGNWSNIGIRFAANGVRFAYVSLDAAEAAVLGLGATRHEHQPGTSFRVFLDPAGHPFCLCTD